MVSVNTTIFSEDLGAILFCDVSGIVHMFRGLTTRMKMLIMALCGNYRTSAEMTMEHTDVKQATIVEWTIKHLI